MGISGACFEINLKDFLFGLAALAHINHLFSLDSPVKTGKEEKSYGLQLW